MQKKPDSINELENLYKLELKEIEGYISLKDNNCYRLDANRNIIELKIANNSIGEIHSIYGLHFLENLDLSGNQITIIENLEGLEKLKILNLCKNGIKGIQNINNRELKELNLSDNNIIKIENLDGLKKLENLNLSINNIEQIEGVSSLENLMFLNLFSNKIIEIDNISALPRLLLLNLSNNKIKKIQNLDAFTKIRDLDLSSNEIEIMEGLDNLLELQSLNVSFNNIFEVLGLDNLNKLETLQLSGNNLSEIKSIENLTELRKLWISYNNLVEINIKSRHLKLELFSITGNRAVSIKNFQNIRNVKTIFSDRNDFVDLKVFARFKKLQVLNVAENNILDIATGDLPFLKQLEDLKINKNPFVELSKLKLEDKKNHKDILINYILMNEEIGRDVPNPVKVLFLGNHSSGKSTFANYFVNIDGDGKKKFGKVKGTHILNIYNYMVGKEGFPKALIYDFGGQDYYHGVYKTFLSNDCINVLFWKDANDSNSIRPDSNKLVTQDFTKGYWLNQLKYYNRKSESLYKVLVVQTFANTDERKVIGTDRQDLNIVNEFFVELSKDTFESKTLTASLLYFENSLIDLIERHQVKEKKPEWYIEFLKYIYEYEKHNSVPVESLKEIYNRDIDISMKYLPSVLDQLHRYGKVIYFKDNKKLNNTVWLNPAKTVEYIHQQVLNKRFISKNKGIIQKHIFEKLVNDVEILELLIENKVIFLDDTIEESPQYIIPGYLPLATDSDENYFLFSDFSINNFIIKFKNFIPFGFINHLICYYGRNPDRKLYWRNQIIFTSKEEKAKVNIKLDFETLEIKVNINPLSETIKINDLEQEIFADLMTFYLDIDLFSYREEFKKQIKPYNNYLDFLLSEQRENIPSDLFISVDNKYFVNFIDLQNKIENFETSIVYDRSLNKDVQFIKRSINYKKFTNNRMISNMKKIFISYSNKDYTYLEKLRTHLSPFSNLEIIEAWDCTELQTGNWHEQIQHKLKESDIVIFLMSPDFLASSYILNQELLPSFKEVRENGDKKLIFVVARNFAYSALGKFSSLTGEVDLSKPENVLQELPKHQFIPYKKPESGQTERKLLPIKQWPDEDDAFVEVINQISNYF